MAHNENVDLEEITLPLLKWIGFYTEIEAVEACKWLRAAGFPQYAQMYEDQLFPIDIGSVEKDHDFLDKDSIQSLFRRLNTLNKCAAMKIEAPPRKSADESDEEDQCALSDKWRFQRSSRRWSRKDLDLDLPTSTTGDDSLEKAGIRSSSSHDSVLTDNEESMSQQDENSPVLYSRNRHASLGGAPQVHGSPSAEHRNFLPMSVIHTQNMGQNGELHHNNNNLYQQHHKSHEGRPHESPLSPGSIRRAASERIKGAKNNFLKRMESFKQKKGPPKKRLPASPTGERVLISAPVVVNSDSESMKERLDTMGCVDISPSNDSSPTFNMDRLHPNKSGETIELDSSFEGADISPSLFKRGGRVFMDNSNSSLEDTAKHKASASANSSTSAVPSTSTEVTAAELPACFSQLGVPTNTSSPRKNRSSSDLKDIYNLDSSSSSPSSFPKLVANGYIETSSGSQINYRTGSFNLGSESHSYRDSFQRRNNKSAAARASSEEPNTRTSSKAPSVSGEHRLSIYDNVPMIDGDPQKELDMILNDLFKNINDLTLRSQEVEVEIGETDGGGKLDTDVSTNKGESSGTLMAPQQSLSGDNSNNVIEVDTSGLQQDILSLGNAGSSKDQDQSGDGHGFHSTESNLEVPDHHSTSAGSGTSSNHEMSDAESPASREEDGSDPPPDCEMRERRDSGVGSSLTRAPSDRRRHRIRWHSFVKSHRPSLNSQNLQVSNMSAGQLMVLRKLSLLKVTALIEKYSPSNRSGWNWIMPKFMKRIKTPDYKDKNVFGVPLQVILLRTGQPLPQCILYAMRCLRRTARDSVGIFRKSGVRSRIQKLRNQLEADPESVDFETLQAYDVADLLKQYFRELPECLLTNKLSETFVNIFTHVPSKERLGALQAATMLLPDENRQVLQSLLLFLYDMAQHAMENQMTSSNLAVCFAPSLFHMCGPKSNPTASPRRSRKNVGVPDERELLEQKAGRDCLTTMINECKHIFMVPDEMLSKCRLSYIELGDPVPFEELSKKRFDGDIAGHIAYIESCIQGILKESRDKFKGWVVFPTSTPTDVAFKKVGDGHPLRLWKCNVEVEAPPCEVLNRLLRERHLWDEDLMKWRVVEKLDNNSEVFQYVTNTMAPHPTRDFVELRSWRTDLPKGACVLVATSVEHPDAPLIGGVRGVTLASRFLIEPCGSGKSRLTHICRIDLRGHRPEWYNQVYGRLCANYMLKIRDSFTQQSTEGPETKV